MTQVLTSEDGALVADAQPLELSDAVLSRTTDATGMSSPVPDRVVSDLSDPADPADKVLVDQTGRPLGPRALRTRRRILEATTMLLSQKPMREMRVIDIARQIGSSPATFYQYFKDVEDVVLHLAIQVKESTPLLVELIGGSWEGREGYERGKRISNMVIDHWEKYAPILRARNNASDEGNPELREQRMAALMPLVTAFQEAIERAAAESAPVDPASDEWRAGPIDSFAGATVLSSCLERTSMYHAFIEDAGGTREGLIDTTAIFLQNMLAPRR